MACWSAENATKAYLSALKMGKRGKEPDAAEFISALAAGSNAQLMVVASARVAESITLSLVAAAHQTSGQVVCILSSKSDLYASRNALGPYAESVKFIIGDAKTLLLNTYKDADFVLIDCKIDDCEGVYGAAQGSGSHGRGIIVGYNAFHQSGWPIEFKAQFLPIGDGLLVTRIGSEVAHGPAGGGQRKRSRWVVRIDKCTGEEHVYRITSPHTEIEA